MTPITIITINPVLDVEKTKWFTFDRDLCPHVGKGPEVVALQTNSTSNALDAYARLGLCICPACWDTVYVTAGFNEPADEKGLKKFFEPQVSASIAEGPVLVPSKHQ